MPKPQNFAKMFLNEEAKEAKVAKKRKLATETEESNGESSAVVFDEVLAYKADEGAKFSQKIKFSSGEGIGLKGDKVYIFRVFRKDNKDEISKYQFGFDIAAVNNLMLALEKMQKFYNDNK